MATIDQLRSVFGGTSDEATLQAAAKRLGLPVSTIAADVGYDLGGKWGNRASAAVDSAQAQLYGVGEAVGLGDWARRGRESNAAQADVRSEFARDQGAITSYKQVKGLGDAVEYVGGLALDSAPQLGALGVAALTGGPVAAGAVGYGFALGDVLQNQREQAGKTDLLSASALAVPYAAVDTLTGVGGRVAKGALARSGIKALDEMQGVRGALARTGASVGRTALTEGAGETFQEVMNQAGRIAVDSNASLVSDEALDRYGESFVGGAALGGAFGAVGGHRRSESYVPPPKVNLLAPDAAPATEVRGLQLGFNPIAGDPPVVFPDGTTALASDVPEYRAQLASGNHPGRAENPGDFGLPPDTTPVGDVAAPSAPATQSAEAADAALQAHLAAQQEQVRQMEAQKAAVEAEATLTPEQQEAQSRGDAVTAEADLLAKQIIARDERAKAQGLKGTKMFDVYGQLEQARESNLIDDKQFAENLALLKAKRAQQVTKFLTGLAATKDAIKKSDEQIILDAYAKAGKGTTKSVGAPVPAPAATPSTAVSAPAPTSASEQVPAPAAPQTITVGRAGREEVVTREGFLARLAKAQPHEKARVLAVAGLEIDADPTTGRPVLLQVSRPRSMLEVAAAAGITRQAVQHTLAKFGFTEQAIARMASSWNPDTVSTEELGIDPEENGSGFRVESELSKATGQGLVDDGGRLTKAQREAQAQADELLLREGGSRDAETGDVAPDVPEGAVVTDLRDNNAAQVQANIRALLSHIEAPNAAADWDEGRINYSDLPDTLKADWVEQYVWNLRANAGELNFQELARDQARIERDFADWSGQQAQARPAAEGLAGERSRPALVAPAETGGPAVREEPAGSGETGVDPSAGSGSYVGEAGQRQSQAAAPVVVKKKTRKVSSIKASYVGERAAGSERLGEARDMAAAGTDDGEIRQRTGWFRGMYDGQWRREISDKAAQWKVPFADLPESKVFGKEAPLRLGDVLQHDELFKAYPELADVTLVKRAGFLDFGGLQGSFDPKTKKLQVTPYAEDPLSTVLHELQHWIQTHEGFAQGGNESMALDHLTDAQKEKLAAKIIDDQTDRVEKASRTAQQLANIAKLPQLQAMQQAADTFYDLAKKLPTSDPQRVAAYDEMSKAEGDFRLAAFGTSDYFKLSEDQRTVFAYAKDAKRFEKAGDEAISAIRDGLAKISDARSGDPERLTAAIKSSSVAYDAYRRIAGEIEARDVQARQLLTDEERAATEPYSSEKIAKDDAITVRGTDSASESRGGGSNVARVLTEISKLKLDLNADKVVVVQSADQLPPAVKRALNSEAPEGGKVQAFVWNGRAYLIASNIKPGTARAVFLHEVGSHMGLDELLSAREMITLVRQVREWSENPDTLEGRIARRAIERVANAKTDEAQALSETIAYFVEEAVNAGVDPTAAGLKSDLQRWLQTVVRALKAGLQKLKLIDSTGLTAQDVVDMAYGAAHLALTVDGRADGGVSFSTGGTKVDQKLRKWAEQARNSRLDPDAVAPVYANPPALLKMVGVYRPVVMRASDAKHAMKHPETTPDLMASLPDLLASARLVSRRPDGSLRFVLDDRASDGRPFVVALQPETLGKDKVYIVKTMYAHDSSAMSVAAEVRDGRVLYASEEGLARLRDLLGGSPNRAEVTRDSQPAGTIPAKGGATPPTANSVNQANVSSVLTDAALAKFGRNDPSWRAEVAAVAATNAQAEAQRGVKFSIADDAPAQAKRAYGAVHSVMTDIGERAVLLGAFTRDLVRMAARVLPSAKTYDDLVQATQVAKTRAEREVERVLEQYDSLPAHERGTGPGSVNSFLRQSTMSKAWGFVPEYHDKGKIKVDAAMEARFNALSPKAQDLVQAVFRHGHETLQDLKRTVMDTIASEHDALIAAYKKDNDLVKAAEVFRAKEKALASYRSLMDLNGNWPYAPLKRFGNHVVVGMSKAYKDAVDAKDTATMRKLVEKGDHYHVEFFETKREREAQARRLEESGQFGAGGLVQHFEKDGVQDAMYGGRDTLGAFSRLRTLVRDSADDSLDAKANSAIQSLMNDLHLRLLGEASARQSERERKNVSGADADMMRAFATQGRAQAHFIASLKNQSAVQEALLAMKREADAHTPGRDERRDYYNELLRRHVMGLEYSPTPLIEKAMATSSLWMLLTSPSYFLTNATQPFLMSLPVIAGRHGYGRSAAAMTRAYRELMPLLKDGKFKEEDYSRLPADVREAVESLADKGAIDISLTQDLGSWSSDGEGVSRKFSQAVSKLRGVSQTVESINRLATAIAAVRLERERGGSRDAQVDYAGKVIYETHGDYSGYNSPRLMRSGVGRLLTQFRKFQLIQISLFTRLAHSAFKGTSPDERRVGRAALGFSLAHMFAVGGLLGMPGAQFVGWVLRQVFGDDDEPDNPELTLRKAIGNDVLADLLIKGVPKMAGVDLSGRLGAGGMLSLLPYNDVPTDRKGVEAAIVAVAGPFVGGLLPKFGDGLSLIAQGDFLKGSEMLLPKGLGDAVKGARLTTQGLSQRNGDVVMSPEDISVLDGLMQAVGLPTNTLTDRAFRADAKFKTDEFYAKRAAAIKRRYVEAYSSGDAESMSEARQEWADMEAARVAHGYKRQGISDLLKAPREAQQRQARTIGGVGYRQRDVGFVQELDEIS